MRRVRTTSRIIGAQPRTTSYPVIAQGATPSAR
jgi:hypothetical protein